MHDMERGGIEVVNILEDARKDDEVLEFSLAQGSDANKETSKVGGDFKKESGLK